MAKDPALFAEKLKILSENLETEIDFSKDALSAADLELVEAALAVNDSLSRFFISRSALQPGAEFILDRIISNNPEISFDDSVDLSEALGGMQLEQTTNQNEQEPSEFIERLRLLADMETLVADFSVSEPQGDEEDDDYAPQPAWSLVDLEKIELALKQNHELIILSFSRCNLGATAAAIIARIILTQPKLQKIYLDDNDLGDYGVIIICEAIEKSCNTLRVLDLSGNAITAISAVAAGRVLAKNMLFDLMMDGNLLNNDGVEQLLCSLPRNTNLSSLSLSGCAIYPAGAKSIANATEGNSGLIELDLSNNPLGDAGIICLAEKLALHPVLKDLDVESCMICAAGAWALGKMLIVTRSLIYLNLKDNQINALGLSGLDGQQGLALGLIQNRSLESLDLEQNDLGDEGAAIMRDVIVANYFLNSLILRGCRITRIGADFLAKALETNRKLSDLVMSENPIADVGVKAIVTALKVNDVIETLGLGDCDITDDGAKDLLELLKNGRDLSLNLDDNDINVKMKRELSHYVDFEDLVSEDLHQTHKRRRRLSS